MEIYEHIQTMKVQTSFKIKYHGDELDKDIWRATTRKHNELVDYLTNKIQQMEKQINDLERKMEHNVRCLQKLRIKNHRLSMNRK